MQSTISTSTCMLDDFRCRLCFTSSDINLQPLFPPGEDCFLNDLLSRIYDCLTIHVSFLEDFCSVICSVCRDKINSFYTFKKQCQTNDGYLREKRSRQMSGVDLERLSRMNGDQPDEARPSQCKVDEPQEEDMLRQTKSIFAPDQEATESTSTADATANVPLKVDVAVQMSGSSSSESFRGFPNEFINNSVTESCEMKSEPPITMDDIQECHVPVEKLELKPSVAIHRSNTKEGNCPTTRIKYKQRIKTEQTNQNKAPAPKLLSKKTVLYFDGYEYRKPRTWHGGSIKWECCKLSCPATLLQKPDGKLRLIFKHQRHQQQVVSDGMMLDRKKRRRVRYMVTNNNHKRKFIYNDSFRYRFSQKLPDGQTVWTCDDQQEGCKAYVRIADEFRSVTPILQHNHKAAMVVRRRIVN